MRTSFRDILVVLLLAGGLLSLWSGVARAARAPEAAQHLAPDPALAKGVVVVVKVPRPWYAPDMLIVRKMRQAIPNYRAIPGLRFKAFTLARSGGEFGGVYLWRDRIAANAWFTPAWHRRVREERGAEAQVRFFDLIGPARFASDLDGSEHADAVATLVVAQAGDRGPDDSDALIVYPIRTRQGVGRLSIWSDESAAQRAIDSWKRARPGASAVVEWFDAPILLPGVAGDAPLAASASGAASADTASADTASAIPAAAVLGDVHDTLALASWGTQR